MKGINRLMHVYLDNIPKNRQARHAFNTKVIADHVINNMTETWNNFLSFMKGWPIITMFEGIRSKVITILAKRMFEAQRIIAQFSPVVYGKIDKALTVVGKMNEKILLIRYIRLLKEREVSLWPCTMNIVILVRGKYLGFHVAML